MKSFSSKIGVLLAAAGSAVGLGSIWKFPYVVGENGGGAFIILYIVCALVFGLPLVMNEFLIGKLSGRSAYGAFCALTNADRWQWLSWTFLLSVFVIMSFYFVVTGWCFYYIVEAASNTFAGMDATALKNHFTTFEGNPLLMITYAIVAIVLTAAVLWFDVNKGIERLSKILMPILFFFLIVMAIHMVFMDGSAAGLRYLFEPDFSRLMCVAALTSTISLMEVVIAFVCEATSKTRRPLNRHQSAVVVALILVFANTLIVLSMTGQADWLTVMGQDLFTSFNVLSTNILIPVGALGTALFSGWFVPKARYQGSRVGSFLYLFVLRWLVPIAIFIIFLDSVNII